MIRTQLMEHQAKCVQFCLDKDYAGLFLDYGSGKTLCALALIQLRRWRRILVVSTKTAIQSTWTEEVRKHTDFRYVIMTGTRQQKLKMLRLGMRMSAAPAGVYHTSRNYTTLFLINYEGVRNVYSELEAMRFEAIMVDESTKIKSPKAIRTKVLWALGHSVKHRFVMTGFPVTEALHEIYAQVKFLDYGKALGNSYYQFLDKYFVRMGQKAVAKKKASIDVLNCVKPFCIRLTNDQLRLPPKVYKQLMLPQTDEQKRVLQLLNDNFRVELGKVKIDVKYIFSLIEKSLEICDGFLKDERGRVAMIQTEKDEALIETLEEIDVRKNKVIIWAAFRFTIAKLHKLLTRLGYGGVVTLTGETERADWVVKRFQHDPKCRILLATQQKAAESITLTSCRYGIYYSNTWSYDLRANSEARIRRKGSEKHSSIIYIDLITKESVERNVYDCLKKKGDLISELKEYFSETITEPVAAEA